MVESSPLARAERLGAGLYGLHVAAGNSALKEPISPELVLVDPELARVARLLLPEFPTPRVVPAPSPPAAVVESGRRGSGRGSHLLPAIAVCCITVLAAATSMAVMFAAQRQRHAATPLTVGGPSEIVDVLAPVRPGPILQMMLRRFGEAPVRRSSGERCRLTWPQVDVDVILVAPRQPCERGTLVVVTVRERGWRTAAGLRIGDRQAHLRRLYPGAVRGASGWWRLQPGNGRTSVGGLFAHVQRGRVEALRVE